MNEVLSPLTQAILLLTAPLVSGKAVRGCEQLALGECKKLVVLLHGLGYDPGNFLGAESASLTEAFSGLAAREQLAAILERGFALSQAFEDWQARSIAVQHGAIRALHGAWSEGEWLTAVEPFLVDLGLPKEALLEADPAGLRTAY